MPFWFFKKNDPSTLKLKPVAGIPVYVDRADNLSEFRRLEANNRSGFSWVGMHPNVPRVLYFLHVESKFERRAEERFSGITHQYFVGAKQADVTTPLYIRQAKMDAPGMSSNEVARTVGYEMVKCLLLCKNPKEVPGFLFQAKKRQESRWIQVFQDARNKVILIQLKKYHISVEAYRLNPDTYNAIKDESPFQEEY